MNGVTDKKKEGLYLCVDCGASKTAVAIIDKEGTVKARYTGGPSNFSYLGLEGFLKVIEENVHGALSSLSSSGEGEEREKEGGKRLAFDAAWFGTSGVDTPEAIAEITPRLSSLLSLPPHPPYLIMANDTTLLAAPLVSAAQRNPDLRTCVAVVGGTGSIAASFQLSPPPASSGGEPGPESIPKEIARIGGWGWMLGDEGSGYHIGKEAVRQLLRQHELLVLSGNPPSPPKEDADTYDLRTRVLDLFGVKSAPELLAAIHDVDPPADIDKLASASLPPHRLIPRPKRLSQLAPFVIRAAFGDLNGNGGGDPLALEVLKVTSSELASQITLLLEPPSGPDPSTPLAVPAKTSILIFGGSLVGIPKYQALILDALRSRGHVFAGVEHVSNVAETGGRVLHELFNPRVTS